MTWRGSVIFVIVGTLVACSGGESDEAATVAAQVTAATTPATTVAPTTLAPATTEPATTVAPTTTAAPTTTLPPELELLGPGKYPVGVSTVTVADATGARNLTVDVWYPIKASVEAPPHEYTLLPGTFYRSPDALATTEADLADDGPFPLVVYSHGSGGLRYIASNYTETIASHGYIVVAPDHTGNTAVDRLGGAETDFDVTALNRPNDVKRVIDAFTSAPLPDTAGFAQAVDAESIAVTGHSFGGFTALAMASGYSNPLGAFAADARVDAIIPVAPASGDGTRLLTDADLAQITVPMMILVGTDDKTTPVDPNVERPWELSPSEPFYRVELVAAEHQTFTDLCDYQEFLPTLTGVPEVVITTIEDFAAEGCSPGDMPIERAKSLTNTFAVRFLDSVFRDGAPLDASTFAVPEDVLFQHR